MMKKIGRDIEKARQIVQKINELKKVQEQPLFTVTTMYETRSNQTRVDVVKSLAELEAGDKLEITKE